MKLANLFKFIELTRSQPQYGYALSGMRPNDLSNLAEHHYCVTFIAWQLARLLKRKGVSIDVGKTLEYALVHDLGELFGGDVAMPYARANKKARPLAKAFEDENRKFLAEMFGEDEEYLLDLFRGDDEPRDLESVVAKVADYMEITHFKFYMDMFVKDDIVLVAGAINKRIEQAKDAEAREVLGEVVEQWKSSFPGKNTREILVEMWKE